MNIYQSVTDRIAAEFIQQPVQLLQLRSRDAAAVAEQDLDFGPVARWPEFRLALAVMVPADHLGGGQVARDRRLGTEVEPLKSPQVIPDRFFSFRACIVTVFHDFHPG